MCCTYAGVKFPGNLGMHLVRNIWEGNMSHTHDIKYHADKLWDLIVSLLEFSQGLGLQCTHESCKRTISVLACMTDSYVQSMCAIREEIFYNLHASSNYNYFDGHLIRVRIYAILHCICSRSKLPCYLLNFGTQCDSMCDTSVVTCPRYMYSIFT